MRLIFTFFALFIYSTASAEDLTILWQDCSKQKSESDIRLIDLSLVPRSIEERNKKLNALYQFVGENYKKGEVLVKRLELKKNEIAKQNIRIENTYQEIANRVKTKNDNVKKYLMKGMTRNEVRKLLGPPDDSDILGYEYYGRYKLSFSSRSQGGVIRYIFD